ncbi:Conserved membrane protein of unknown function [Modestobacter italicus]|uniref:Uncharacterized protein n=1 Tax=Modestobacter italicus (strain DSM 44449 / CECT 9708 / BC 501) TaxID=2732864 RepID=I4F424_MODI5|nr:hypothetical protein [Modestobacter marinus]CCH90387.1 Conserved membrane protein of unknown function [Modestobacter marinus]
MSEPPNSGEYSVRSLAEILREHGLETELGTRPGRRRRTSDDPEVTGRAPRVEPAPRPQAPGRPAAAARATTPPRTPGPAPAAVRSPAGASSTGRAPAGASSAGRTPATTWPDQSGTAGPRPAAGLAGPVAAREAAPVRTASPADRAVTTGPGTGRSAGTPGVQTGRRKSDAVAGPATSASTGLFGTGPSTSAIPATGTTTHRRAEAHPVTGPIPVQRSAGEPAVVEEEPLTAKESALAWLRFAGELVVALAVGIGLYFAFTVLWELMPYVALAAAPLTVTALVAGVAAWRQKRGQGALGVRLLAVLLLAGTVLVIAPAAGLLAG